jgi:glycerate dehydrogenase
MVPLFAAHKGVSGLGPLYTPWQEVLETSDIITLHSPLTPQTRNMIAMPEFRAMKRRPLIINTARGGLVDEGDLVEALEAGLISGAGFDVTVGEPPPVDGPLMRAARRHDVILTPHVAWASDEAQQALADQLMDNVENFITGRPTNLVRGAY